MEKLDIAAEIARGEAMERPGTEDGAVTFLRDLAERFPDDARVAFAHAGALDYAGREVQAAQYRRAIALGLPDDLRPRMYVQFGSTLRNFGDVAGAVELLEEGHEVFPDDLAIACFLALARHSAGKPSAALAGLIAALLRVDANGGELFQRYRRALGTYAAELVD